MSLAANDKTNTADSEVAQPPPGLNLLARVPLAVWSGIGIVIVWQLVIWAFSVQEYIAPTPIAVANVFVEKGYVLWINFWPTLFEALAGFAAGNLVAVLIAVAFIHSRILERAFFPIAVLIQTIPIIAVAPILVLLFGNGYAPKIMIAALISFFPMLVNMVRGLRAVKPETMELMRILSATRYEIFWNVRIQSSLPFFFAALKISATTCVIGAVVAEWIGSNYGLGALIIQATYNYQSPLLYATVLLSALMAITLFTLVGILEKRVIRWNVNAVT